MSTWRYYYEHSRARAIYREVHEQLRNAIVYEWTARADDPKFQCRINRAKTHPMECECGDCFELAMHHVLSWSDRKLQDYLRLEVLPQPDSPERLYLQRLIIRTCFARTHNREARQKLLQALAQWKLGKLEVPPAVVAPARLRRIQPPTRSPQS